MRGGYGSSIMAGCMKMKNGFTSLFMISMCLLLISSPKTSGQRGAVSGNNRLPVTDLQDGEESVVSGSNRFCYKNSVVPSWRQTWTRIQVKVWSSNVFKVQMAEGEEELQELERFSVWSWMQSLLRERQNETTINIGLFSNKTCFKIDPAGETSFTVKAIRKFDIYLFLVFLAGALLFLFADSLSRSQVFFYSAGMSTGMIASLIIVFFILARFLPKKSPFYVLIVGGWSFSLYAIQLVGRNLQTILREHWNVALGYVTVVGFVTFAVCYRYGPLVDEKSMNILSWTLQLFGLLLVYLGIQVQQVAFAVIVAALISKHLEHPLRLSVTACRRLRAAVCWKTEPRRLLTEEEFQREAEEETRKALEDLRKNCSSPEFRSWRTVTRLQSPKRFADFVEGSPHLVSNEVSVHAQEYGFGGSFFEEEFFDTDDEEDDDMKPLKIPE